MDNIQIVSSFSGGETSAFMTIKLKEKYPNLKVVFANTGQEHEETLKFVEQCDKVFDLNIVWLEARVNTGRKGTTYSTTNYLLAARNGEPFEEVIKKYGIPNQSWPHCTRELKQQPIKAYLKELYGKDYQIAVGIREDEKRRASKNASHYNVFYPLLDYGYDKQDVISFWEEQPFRLGIENYQGNCRWCWKKSHKKHALVWYEESDVFKFPLEMEVKYGMVGPEDISLKPRVFFRGKKSTRDLIMKEIPLYINSNSNYKTLRDKIIYEYNEREEGGCSESCEAFGQLDLEYE